jgi:enoyl-CoA hydratase
MSVVDVQVENEVAVVTLNRPDRLNALSLELVDELHRVFDDAPTSPIRGARVVVLLGAGRAFCAGADLAAAALGSQGRQWDSTKLDNQERFSSLVAKMRALSQPIVVGVHGSAAGGGFALALAADVRVAGESAKFIPSFLNIGLSGCEMGTSFFLPRFVGLSNASMILMAGDAVSASEAYRMGLVSRVVPDRELLAACMQVARKMTGASPLGLVLTKRQLCAASDSSASLAATLHTEDVRQLLCLNDPRTIAFTAEKSKKFVSAARSKM